MIAFETEMKDTHTSLKKSKCIRHSKGI